MLYSNESRTDANRIDVPYRMNRSIFNIKTLGQNHPAPWSLSSSVRTMRSVRRGHVGDQRRFCWSAIVSKTSVLHQATPNECASEPDIKIKDIALEILSYFLYLKSHLSSTAKIDKEINHHISCANSSFGRFRRRIFDNRDLTRQKKVRMLSATVIPTLLYGVEIWVTTRRHTMQVRRWLSLI